MAAKILVQCSKTRRFKSVKISFTMCTRLLTENYYVSTVCYIIYIIFSVIREIKVGKSRVSKSAILTRGCEFGFFL